MVDNAIPRPCVRKTANVIVGLDPHRASTWAVQVEGERSSGAVSEEQKRRRNRDLDKLVLRLEALSKE